MPNWCENNVEITGSKEEIKALREWMGNFDFNKIIPMPQELLAHSAPAKIISETEYLEQEKEDKEIKKGSPFPFRGITENIQKDLIKKYGFDNWYEWAVDAWGTKWGIDEDQSNIIWKDTSVSACLTTAWCAPDGIYNAITNKFPDLEITWHYSEPGMCFSGNLETGEEFDYADPCDCGECDECLARVELG